MANFAKEQLKKYGWTEGKGLGKNENGITEALRPNLKFDTVGVGHKDTDSHQWWEVAFNKAASNIVIDSQSNGVAISSLKKDTEDKKAKKLKSTAKYGNFLKTSTLWDGNLIQENSFDKVEVVSTENDIIFPQLTDEELFKACGGRTAHKGARHGLTQNGKLERIAQQEKKLLSLTTIEGIASTEKNSKSSKNKPQRAQHRESHGDDYEMDSNANTILPSPLAAVDEYCFRRPRTNRIKQKKRMNDLTHQLNILCNMNDDEKEAEHNASDSGNTKRKKQLKRRRSKEGRESTTSESTKTTLGVETANEIHDIPLPATEKKKKKKHTRDPNEEEVYDTSVKSQKKKKAKRKRSRSRKDTINFTAEFEEEGPCVSKKNKKKNSILESPANNDDTEYDISRTVSDETIEATLRSEKYDGAKLSDAHSKNEPQSSRGMSRRKKKSELKMQRKQQLKLDRITDNLMAVHFDADDTSTSAKPKRKMDAIMEKLLAADIAENVTKAVKKSGK